MPNIDLLKEKHSCCKLHLWMFAISWITFSIQHPVWLQNILLQFSDYTIPWKLHEVFFSSCVNVEIVSDISDTVSVSTTRGLMWWISQLLYAWQFTVNWCDEFQSYFMPGNLLPITSSWRQALWNSQPVFFFNINTCSYSLYITSSQMKGWACHLQVLLALTSAFSAWVPQDSSLHFTVSDLRLSQPGGPGPRIYILQEQGGLVNRQALGSLFVTYDLQGYGGGIQPRLHTGWWISSFACCIYTESAVRCSSTYRSWNGGSWRWHPVPLTFSLCPGFLWQYVLR
jgi:hypothetical protein